MNVTKHAFIINIYKDIEQFEITIPLLLKYWPESEVYIYFDGPKELTDRVCHFEKDTHIIQSPLETNKSKSTLNAIRELCQKAYEDHIETVSFLHADMIPLHASTFYSFVRRFHESKKALTFTQVIPRSNVIDFCNLHFNLNVCFEKKIFPVAYQETRPDIEESCNEKHLVASFQKNNPLWTQLVYPMWMISFPYTAHEMIGWSGSAIAHNFMPETSIVHINDRWFWDNYSQLAGFTPKIVPKGISTMNL